MHEKKVFLEFIQNNRTMEKQMQYYNLKIAHSLRLLAMCCTLGFSCRLFAVILFESIIHKFDPC